MAVQKDINDITSFVYDKSYDCPVCESKFKTKTIKSKDVRLVGTDTDLRPIYSPIDSLLYEVVLCPICGYAALAKVFDNVTYKQAEAIKAAISSKYISREYPTIHTPEIAIEKFKLAYLSATVKKSKKSELSYLQLKVGWIYRSIPDKENETRMLQNAYSGFVEAMQTEKFPIMEFDELTLTYLLGDVARRIGKPDEANRWFSRLLGNRDCPDRIKDRIRDVRELMKDEAQANEDQVTAE